MHGGPPDDRRAGVVWHTQGSGKSLSMLFYAGCMVREPAMRNPTLVLLTDRNDLDDELFGQFQRCEGLLGQTPVQADSRGALRALLALASGGVVFTAIQKFLPAKGEKMAALSDVSFFHAPQVAPGKHTTDGRKAPEQLDAAVRQLVSKAITADGQVIDVFTAAGLPKPDIGRVGWRPCDAGPFDDGFDDGSYGAGFVDAPFCGIMSGPTRTARWVV